MNDLASYTFEAKLVPWGPYVPPKAKVVRTVVMRGDQSLAHLNLVLRAAFGWWMDDHLYAFWLDGEFWSGGEKYVHPYEIEEAGKEGRSAEIPIGAVGLEQGHEIAYIFDFGDEWRVLLTVKAIEPAEDGAGYPLILGGKGDPPPQYPPLDEDEA